MSDRPAGGRTNSNVPSALSSSEESQGTFLRQGARYLKAGMTVVLQALPSPSFIVEPEEEPRRLLVGTLEDLRPLRDLQARLFEGEELMAQGALVAGVAHEVNNPANLLLANMHELELAIGQLFPCAAVGAEKGRLLK